MRRRGLARSHRRSNEDIWTLYFSLPPLGIPRHCGGKGRYKGGIKSSNGAYGETATYSPKLTYVISKTFIVSMLQIMESQSCHTATTFKTFGIYRLQFCL